MSEASVSPSLFGRLVAFWDEREPATALALLRIFVGAVLAYDLIYLSCLDLQQVIFGDAAAYNFGYSTELSVQPWLRQLLGPGPEVVAYVVYGGIVAALLFSMGLFTRVSGVLVVLTQLQLVELYATGNRGIDQLLRIMLVFLICSRSHETLSLDALWRHRKFARPNVLIPAWPRYMVIAQLLWLYTSAAISKGHTLWSASGDYMALYYILRYPHFVRVDMAWVPTWLTQVGTFMTIWFEWLAGLMVLACAQTRRDPARTRRSTRFWWVFKRCWILVGLGLHTTLLITMNIGIFTTGMLSLYFCWVSPALLQRLPAEGPLAKPLALFRYDPSGATS